MSTKKLQIIGSLAGQASNADTVDGKHASDFAASTDFEQLKSLVGDTAVSEQIENAKPAEVTSEDIVEWMMEENVFTPLASSSGEVYTTNDNKILII